MSTQTTIQNTIDATLGGGTVSAPIWLQHFDIYVATLLAVGGAVLLGLRIWIAIRTIKGNKDNDED